jgi:carboxymethylenebutenolidase
MRERTDDLRTDDGVMRCHTYDPGDGNRHPGVVLYMDAFGVRPAFQSMAQRLASAGYVVALPDLYYRSAPVTPFDPAAVAAGGPERDRFKAMIATLSNTLVMRDTAAVVAHLDGHPAVRPGHIGVVGYCMGGGFALCAAGAFPARVAAAAVLHGGSLATAASDSAHRLAPEIRGRVYIGVAEIDASFQPDQRARVEDALRAAGVSYTLEVYPGARHGFAVTGHVAYDRDASERHWERLLALFEETLHT